MNAKSTQMHFSALATILTLALAFASLPSTATAAEKLFDFGELNVDLSKVQAKPQSAPGSASGSTPAQASAPAPTPAPTPTKQAPDQQLESTPESPAPKVLPKDNETAIDTIVAEEQLKVAPVKVTPSTGGKQHVQYPVPEDRDVIEVKIAAGSEKRGWFEEAAQRFMADPDLKSIDGKPIRITIDKIGSIKSGSLIRDGKSMHQGRNEYQVWAPASSIFRGVVEDAFTGGKLFETDESVARSPMVFVT
ncbi:MULTISPECIES: substrate-binding domain-containing protein [Thiorhodovibrio]|uniref:substrate-binding domain-containing protein n=1 Tax=Thiorhodovibrio TaxID=61593 RepID=UPI001F5D24D3|nr:MULTISPECIES: substrate-binding domain-containing protein [Thiorhodovibrio]